MPFATISNRIFFGYLPYLQDGSFQCTYIIYNSIIDRTDTIQTDAQTYHIELCSKETLNTCRVADVTEYLMRKCCLQLHRGCFKHLYLSTRKCIKLRCITAYKVREYRPCNDSILALQPFYKSWHILGSKAQTVHTRIQFYMNREVGDAFFFCLLNQCIQQMEAVHFRLQLIIEHSLECRHLRIHNDNARRNTCFAQFGTFVGHSHSQIIDMMFL